MKLDALFIMEALVKSLAEFFTSITTVQAHWYRVFDPEDTEADCQLIKTAFPSIVTLMMMDPSYMMQLLLEVGLVKGKKVKEGYKYYACRDSWDHFISSEKDLSLETTTFAINRKRHVYISVGTWCTANPPKTPASIWKIATKEGGYKYKKPSISTATMRFAESIARLFAPNNVLSSSSSELDKINSDEEGDDEESSYNNTSESESSSNNNISESKSTDEARQFILP